MAKSIHEVESINKFRSKQDVYGIHGPVASQSVLELSILDFGLQSQIAIVIPSLTFGGMLVLPGTYSEAAL